MSVDEFDAKCWRAFKKAVASLSEPGKMSAPAVEMASGVQRMLIEVEVAVSEGREP